MKTRVRMFFKPFKSTKYVWDNKENNSKGYTIVGIIPIFVQVMKNTPKHHKSNSLNALYLSD